VSVFVHVCVCVLEVALQRFSQDLLHLLHHLLDLLLHLLTVICNTPLMRHCVCVCVCVCVCLLTLHQLSQEGDGLWEKNHVVLLQFGGQFHQHQERGETHLRGRRRRGKEEEREDKGEGGEGGGERGGGEGGGRRGGGRGGIQILHCSSKSTRVCL